MLITDSFEPFLSPIDKKWIKSKKELKDHNRKHNVTNTADFSAEYVEKAQKRKKTDEKADLDKSRINDLIWMADAIQDRKTRYDPHMRQGWITYDPECVYLF